MTVWTISVTGTFHDDIVCSADTEAEARELALDVFEEAYRPTDTASSEYLWDKVEIVKVEEGSSLDEGVSLDFQHDHLKTATIEKIKSQSHRLKN